MLWIFVAKLLHLLGFFTWKLRGLGQKVFIVPTIPTVWQSRKLGSLAPKGHGFSYERHHLLCDVEWIIQTMLLSISSPVKWY